MIALGTIVNTAAVLVGGDIGLVAKKRHKRATSNCSHKGYRRCSYDCRIVGSFVGNADCE